jgi:hypothetical protein
MSNLQNWTLAESTTSITFSHCSLVGPYGIAVGQDASTSPAVGTIYYSTNYGIPNSWTEVTTGLTSSLNFINCEIVTTLSGTCAIAVGLNSDGTGAIYYSTFDGTGFPTWTAANLGNSYAFYGVAIVTNSSGTYAIAVGETSSPQNGAIYYSTLGNGGPGFPNWTRVTTGLTGTGFFTNCEIVTTSSGTYAIAVGANSNGTGAIYYSTFDGTGFPTWAPATLTGTTSYFNYSAIVTNSSGSYAIAVGSNNINGIIYYSALDNTTGFQTWTRVAAGLTLSGNFFNCEIVTTSSGTYAIAVGRNNNNSQGVIYYSTFSGSGFPTWTRANLSGTPTGFYSSALVDNSLGSYAIAVGSDSTGGVIYHSTLGVSGFLTWTKSTFFPVGPAQTLTSSAIVSNSNNVYAIAAGQSIYNSDPNTACFNEGTKILCLNADCVEEYKPVEFLKKGDLVKSYKRGYQKIDSIGKKVIINNPKSFDKCMYKMKKTDSNGLIEDLIVTGGHSILVDDLGECKEKNEELFGGSSPVIEDKFQLLAAVSKDFQILDNNDSYTYYHFVLENDENDDSKQSGVWANGILTETPSKNYFLSMGFSLF